MQVGPALLVNAGDVYKSYDAQGTPVYSDKKPGGNYEIIFSTKDERKTPEAEQQPVAAARTMDSVRAITSTINPDLNQIYLELLRADSELNGKVTTEFTIAKEGNVTSCGEDESEMTKAAFNGKICEKIQALDFGLVESERSMNVSFTFNFNPP